MIYLDNAATTLVKPQSVYLASDSALKNCGGAGRGGHSASMLAAEMIFTCRSEAAALFDMDDPERVVLTMNATHALNIAIRSLLGEKAGTALISGYEHNSVVRPLKALEPLGVKARVFTSPLFDQNALLESFYGHMRRDVDCVVCSHVSNVFGYILPIEEIDALCREKGVPLIVDASQSAGCIPLSMKKLRAAAFMCMPGHKGLYGPQGTGLLLCGENAPVVPLMRGGTGSNSSDPDMPIFLPDALESGTQNAPGAAALAKGIRFVREKTPEVILSHETSLISSAFERLRALPGLELFYDHSRLRQTGVLSFRAERLDCEQAAGTLSDMGFCLRAGLHCSPLAHKSAGTERSGTVRLSASAFTTGAEISDFCRALEKILKNR